MKYRAILLLASIGGILLIGLALGEDSSRTIPLTMFGGETSLRLSWETPEDVEGKLRQKSYAAIQRESEIFSWQDFIALNWPASAQRGIPAKDKPLHADGPRVWETWMAPSEVFLKNNGIPAWNPNPNAAPKELHDTREPTVSDGVLPPSLKDQRGNPVYFEIRLNRVFVDYIVANKLYDAESQAKLTQVDAPPGSILVKAAWRVLGPDESDFYSTEALVPAHPLSGSSEKRRVKVGLVGFHIMHKTPSAPQWIWSTFEHVRNVNGPDASFHNVRCVDGAVNIQTPDGVPNQVTRVIPIPDGDPHLPEINKTVRAALAPSVFQHYEQIGTQWPVPASTEQEHPTVFEVRPALLGNTVLETYIQNTSSCMGCHAMARTVNAAQFVSSDFTFTLAQARPGQKEPGVIDPPRSPSNYDDLASWASILRGYQIATSTYETLPEYLPQSKLHCQSCHLNAGGNPRASWWVGMIAKYSPYGSGMFLQDRINQCFTRSMNGNALQPAPSVPNPDMNALIAYMSWLDRQQKAQGLAMPTSAFPPIKTTLKVDSTRGGKIYLQKCAFCHGADGQGRYESGTYYRPALWGPHSYNQQAGMFRMPDLAAFVKSNMPFGSGGELTEQEAWDLAAFINDSKLNNRPVGQNPPDKKPQ